jgi:L-lysine exporter family protein LysE/ArgO
VSGAFGIGFATGLSLILAIGAQNAFVLRQGLLRSHLFWLCLLCASSDALLIAAGIAGFGALTARLPMLPQIMAWGGAAFLIVYGASRFWAAWRGDQALAPGAASPGLAATLATAAAFTWLNPHVYLDTLGLIGAVSTQFTESGDRISFGLGATSASFVFFYALGYGARVLAPIMRSPAAWRLLDLMIGTTMWTIAARLLIA